MTTSELATRLGFKQEPEPLFFLAEAAYLWLDLGHAEQAQRIFDALIILCPDDPAGQLGLGEVHLAAGRYKEAVAAFKRATEAPCVLVETLAYALRKLGDAWLMADSPRLALKAWQQACDTHPDGAEAELARNKIQCLQQGLTLADTAALLNPYPVK